MCGRYRLSRRKNSLSKNISTRCRKNFVAFNHHAVPHPASGKARWHSEAREVPGVDAKIVQELVRHASFNTTMNGYTQAFEPSKRQAQERFADLIMRTGTVGHA
jgi:integrase